MRGADLRQLHLVLIYGQSLPRVVGGDEDQTNVAAHGVAFRIVDPIVPRGRSYPAGQRRSYPAGQRRSPLLQLARTISHVHLMRVLRLLKLKFSLGQLELGIAKLNFNSAAFECVFFFICPSQPTQLLASGICRVF